MMCVMPSGGPWQKVDGKWQSVDRPVKETNSQKHQKALDDILKKYSGRFEGKKTKLKKKELKKQVEWVDKSFIKAYTSHEEMLDVLTKIETTYPHIAYRNSIGHSVEGRELGGLIISQGVREQRVLLKPMVKYVANIHGDEGVGRELLLGLARHLTENYGSDPRVTRLVDSVELHLVPSANPDGNKMDTRHNAHDEDLNRSFPGWSDLGMTRNQLFSSREAEVEGLMEWILDNPFVLSISFHDGRVMVNYPWDDSPLAVEGEKAVCPDDEVFCELAALYAEYHSFMWTGKCLCHSETFNKGISNGAEWYVVDNGMQDFNYLFSNCMEITVELSCDKKPPPTSLQTEWENNLAAMMVFIEAVHGGIKGKVVDQDGHPLSGAEVHVVGLDKSVTSSTRGEFWRLLLPATYLVQARFTSPLGVLESEVEEVQVTSQLGQGALALDLVARVRLEEMFIVTTVRVGPGGSTVFDQKLEGEVRLLFSDCRVLEVGLGPSYKRLEDEVGSRQVVFTVKVVISALPMFAFFEERWGEAIVRLPDTEFKAKKLQRRIKMYAEDKWCGRREDWQVRLA